MKTTTSIKANKLESLKEPMKPIEIAANFVLAFVTPSRVGYSN